jgi:pilus assembly protein CpaE
MELKLLLAGQSKAQVESIAVFLRTRPEFKLSIRILHNGDGDPLGNLAALPDAMILALSGAWEDELRLLMQRPANERPPLLLIGPQGNTRVMRLAMQAGARDFFVHPVAESELLDALGRLIQDKQHSAEADRGRITAVINAKGGSGGSLVSCNMAHILRVLGGLRVALVDIDLQFGALAQYFDLTPNNGLLQAIDALETLDGVALEAYMLKHHSGLHLLGMAHEGLVLPGAEEIPHAEDRLGRLLELLRQRYQHIVMDLPRQIDPFTGVVLHHAEQVVIILQQTLAHIRDAQRLLMYLHELSVPLNRIQVVINRYDKKIPVTAENIENALNMKTMLRLPNDFQQASESVNLGIPLYDHDKNAAITRALIELAEKLSPRPLAKPKGGLFGGLFGKRI